MEIGTLQTLSSSYGEADGNSETGDNTNTEVTESETTKKEVKKMYDSVKENEGFYIGRYETGKDENGRIIIQKGANPYTNVTWAKNGQMNEEEVVSGTESNPDGAIEIARKFDTENAYTDATSTLCYGVQWDAALTFIDPDYTGVAKDSTGKGNYNEDANINSWKGNVTLTGASEDYKVNNIYDLAGNVYEWTMESNNSSNRVTRGGIYNRTGFTRPSSYRANYDRAANQPSVGFRITLYL